MIGNYIKGDIKVPPESILSESEHNKAYRHCHKCHILDVFWAESRKESVVREREPLSGVYKESRLP